MSDLLDKIMVVEGESVELSPDIRDRMKKVFDEAVEQSNENAYLDGIEITMATMINMGLDSTRKLVQERMVSDGVIELADPEGADSGDEAPKNREIWIDEVVRMIG